MFRFIFTSFFTMILLLTCVTLSYPEEVRGVSDKTIKIGLMGGLTGPAADVWIPISNGVKALFNIVNENGGIHGRKIKYILEDDRYSIPLAISSFKKLFFRDKIFALQGASGLGHSAAIIPLAKRNKIPILTPNSEKRFFYPAMKHVFCIIPWYQDHAKGVMEYIYNDLKIKRPKIALMYPDMGSGKDSRDTMRKLVKVYPVDGYKEIVIAFGGVDFTTEALTLRKWKPDVVYIHGYISDTASILKSARRLKFSTKFIASQYSCVPKTVALAGEAAKELIGINCYGIWEGKEAGVKELRKASKLLDPKVKKRDTNFFQGWFAATLFR
ncbi:MAG: ABC transporter substrate-binding protein, partial [Spirochaetota bacterium]|nr:ABC transporter substrate-binding protein [Spirochaetota bacterium]